MTDEALAVAFRTGMPYVGLRDHAHDPELDHLIPPDAARTARVVPLTADHDRIRLAVADPEPDLSALEPYLSGRQIHLALAPREELDRVLGPPPVRVAEPQPIADESSADDDEPLVAERPEPLAGDIESEAAEAESLEGVSPLAPDAGPVSDEEEPALEEVSPLASDASAVGEEERAAEGEPAASVAVAAAAATPPPDDHPELAGEVPSWLEPRRRRWRVALALIVVFLVLVAAAAAVYAYVVT